MRAFIKVWGREYPVVMIVWDYTTHRIFNITFRDENDNRYTVFNKSNRNIECNLEKNKGNTDVILTANLDEIVYLKEKTHRRHDEFC